MNFGWIDAGLLRDFQAEGTDAHTDSARSRMAGWSVSDADILISFKRVLARERLLAELQSWTSSVGFDVRTHFRKVRPREKVKSANRRV